jgi:hypothetical protein
MGIRIDYMSDLIDDALAEADGVPLDDIDLDWYRDTHTAVWHLVLALRKTGPLYHKGMFFRAGEGEAFSDRIEVIEGVRIASEVPVPAEGA